MPGLVDLRSITVVVVDAVESTALASEIGRDRAEYLLAEELDRFEQAVDRGNGFVIRKLGDGMMAGFHSATAALEAGAGMHRSLAQLNDEMHVRRPLQIRIAVATSDAVVDKEISGAAPIHAARIEKLVPAGQTWCTEAVRLLATGRGAYEFDALGAHDLKGLDEPLVLHRVRTPIADVLGMPTTLDVTKRFAFVGREAEAEQLRARWRDAAAGSGRFVVISGEPGLGKTRLCRELAVDVRAQGGIVLFGRCSEELSESYAPFVQILKAMLTHVGEAAGMLGAEAAELARIVPEVRDLVADLAEPSNVDAVTDRLRLFDAVSTWLVTLSQRSPLLLVIDDLSWADEASVQLLRHIAPRVASERVLILASYRPSDAHPPARSLVREGPLIDRLHLRGLVDDEVVAFVEAVLGDLVDDHARSRVTDVGRQVGGSPLYLGEMVPSLVDHRVLVQEPTGAWRAGTSQPIHVPPAVDELIRARTERLTASCQQLLRAAAVFGFEFPADPVIAVVDLSPLDAAAALEEADAAAICQCDLGSTTYQFSHAIIRQAIYDGASRAWRDAMHSRIAGEIESCYSGQLGDWAESLAYHFENGIGWADAERAIHYLRLAGHTAADRLAHDHAADLHGRAGAIAQRWGGSCPPELLCDVLVDLGTAQRRAGSGEARQTLTAAAHLAIGLGDATRAATAVLGIGRGTFSIVGSVDAERVLDLRRAIDLVGPRPSKARAQLLATLSTELAFDDDDPTSADRASNEALAVARDLNDPDLLVTVLGKRLVAMWRADRIDERRAIAHELETICNLAETERPAKFLGVMIACHQTAMEAGDFVTADRLLAWIEENAETLHQPATMAYAKLRLASRACTAGRFDEAERLAGEAYQLSAQAGQPDAHMFHVGQLFVIRFHQGRTAEVIDNLATVAAEFPGNVALTAAVALGAAELGDDDRCRQTIRPVLAQLGALRRDLNWLMTLALSATNAHHLGERDAASRIRAMIAPYRHLFVDTGSAFLGSTHHYYALLSSLLDDDEETDGAFDAAIAAHAAVASPPWIARTHIEYAGVLAARGVHAATRAHEHAEAALRLGQQWGLGRVVELAQRLTGVEPSSGLSAGRGSGVL